MLLTTIIAIIAASRLVLGLEVDRNAFLERKFNSLYDHSKPNVHRAAQKVPTYEGLKTQSDDTAYTKDAQNFQQKNKAHRVNGFNEEFKKFSESDFMPLNVALKNREVKGIPVPSDHVRRIVVQPESHLPDSQYWSKRELDAKGTLKGRYVDSAISNTDDEKQLDSLVYNENCTKNLHLCSELVGEQRVGCVIDCYLGKVLLSPKTKYLYRLQNIFQKFAQLQCPIFGSIYDEISSVLKKGISSNTLAQFLNALGIDKGTDPIHTEFIKNAPLALFNNMVKLLPGVEFENLKPIMGVAKSAAVAELESEKTFATRYHNPLCKTMPETGWILSMIDAVKKHQVLTDIFLQGFYILSRAVTIHMQYPLDSLFSSWLMGIKMLAGVECSLIPYAEKGKVLKCMPSTLQSILDEFLNEAEKNKNPFSWMVCGAHQIDVPSWIKDKISLLSNDKLGSRKSAHDEEDPVGTFDEDIDLVGFPDPEETFNE